MSQTKPSIVFAHGIWADGSCFSKVIPALQADGYEVMSTQNSLDTLEGDVKAVTDVLGRVSGPTILVGHSYGGTVITAAGTDDRVVGLVYIAALAPEVGETSNDVLGKSKTPAEIAKHIDVVDGRLWMRRDGIKYFAGDLPEKEQNAVFAVQVAPDAGLFDQPVDRIAPKETPKWYIVAKNDRTVPPEVERFCAQRMGVTPVEADSSHVVMLSKPEIVIDVIRKAAKAV
jgi:pimeloyl-ACP methyl ester carboxylesterase